LKILSNKISLGTAKLGIDGYGFSSNPLPDDKTKFLEKSYRAGIKSIDTSPRYGNAEKIIGGFINNINSNPLISSKIDGLKHNNHQSPRIMIESVKRSINRMNISKLDVCYLHQNDLNIISDPYIQEGLFALKEMNLIGYCGTSVYSFEELDYTVLSGLYDFIQVPVNILDTSYYDRIVDYKSEIKIAARSIFLQGILFNNKTIQKKIKYNKLLLQSLQKLETLCRSFGVELSSVCIAYINELEMIDQIIIGTSSIDNLKANIDSTRYLLDKNLSKMIGDLASGSKSWTNPRSWNK
jgi:aryl-alcohol dehydrogenase-like predicted oxidoreductase